mmetsp:Transcript_15816/g.20647  ORF Transcript_15816/g.20647 Transcript_15816/m.20647 type:complete len:172 (+) Transcript_15816:130-645(+)|eukprot:CAMPEP_0198153754 /NCGR_PEP_ID=MMETSP1443-20131203/65584_1 /TAXON_ID=186043 /ORGANISM="Entomoneis sp., Strain CCMP2396" /LENGTH=171 /DNA_ID=CAMNT_0043820201 /DNA_START=52 /DNA_END=567 /DNA_ORIENTATION=-
MAQEGAQAQHESCTERKSPSIHSGKAYAHAIRVGPDQDLVSTILKGAREAMALSNSEAAFVMTAVGSLKEVTLRMASANRQDGTASNDIKTWKENVEIVSLVGTLTGISKHLHMCISKADGSTVGGHLISGKVFTTLELVIGTIEGVTFKREMDGSTGFNELVVSKKARID